MAPSFQTRDSAGVRIIENYVTPSDFLQYFEVSNEYLLDVGSDASELQFESVASVVWWPDPTRLTVADRQARTINTLDLNGNLLTTSGREGEGPGEYRSLDYVGVFRADSLFAFDGLLGRITVLDDQLRDVRVVATAISSSTAIHRPLGLFPDGTILQWGTAVLSGSLSGMIASGNTLETVNMEDGTVEVLDTVMGEDVYFFDVGGVPNSMYPPFGHRIYAGTYSQGFYTADSNVWEVSFRSDTDSVEKLVRLVGARSPISREQLVGLKDRLTNGLPDNYFGNAARQVIREMPVPDLMPAFGRYWGPFLPSFLADDIGRLWVLNYHFDRQTPESWSVFSEEGLFLGQVVFPRGFSPMDIRFDKVAGVWRDEFDVEHLRVYELIEPNRSF